MSHGSNTQTGPIQSSKRFENIASKAKAAQSHMDTALSMSRKDGHIPAVQYLQANGWAVETADRFLKQRSKG